MPSPSAARGRERPAALQLALLSSLVLLGACRAKEETPPGGVAGFFDRVATLRILPIEPLERLPASILLLPDGRYAIPETEGVWIHVVEPNGEGVTRLGGQARDSLERSGVAPGTFLSLSGLALTDEGKLLAADRTSHVVSVFDRTLEPDTTLGVPQARAVWQIETLPGGRFAAAVSPLHPEAGGQIVLFGAGDSTRLTMPVERIFRYNRWQPISSARMEPLADGRVLVYWTPIPWARVLNARGDTLPSFGQMTPLYKGPSSGPGPEASLPELGTWYESFTPLTLVESAGPFVVFQFLEAESGDPADTVPGRPPRRAGTRPGSARASERRAYLVIYSDEGAPLAKDVLLPGGHRLLKTNDRRHLYVLTGASPRELEIEVWEPREATRRPPPP